MIVVIGSPCVLPGDPGRRSTAAGRSIDVARGAIEAGARVELVGKIGDDPAGDDLILALADAGIGHVAILRDAARATPVVIPPLAPTDSMLLDDDDEEASISIHASDLPLPTIDGGDLDLALRYLPDHRVVVVAEALDADAITVVAADCSYVGATLVLIVEPGTDAPDLPPGATILEAPPFDPDGLFGRTVGGFAAALDRGASGADALAQATSGAGWQALAG